MLDHEWRRDLDAARHVEKGAGARQGRVERGEFLGAEVHRLGLKMTPEESGVTGDGFFDRAEDDPLFLKFRRQRPGWKRVVVEKCEGRGEWKPGFWGLEQGIGGVPERKAVEFEPRNGAEAPELIGPRGHRQRGKAVPCGTLQFEPPIRQVADSGLMRGEEAGREGAAGR